MPNLSTTNSLPHTHPLCLFHALLLYTQYMGLKDRPGNADAKPESWEELAISLTSSVS